MWNRKDHQQHGKIVFFSVRRITATGIHRDTEKVAALRAWEDQQSSSFCYVHGRASTKPVSCEMCGEGAVELPRENQAEPSSTHCNARTDVYLLLVLGEMPPGVCWVSWDWDEPGIFLSFFGKIIYMEALNSIFTSHFPCLYQTGHIECL